MNMNESKYDSKLRGKHLPAIKNQTFINFMYNKPMHSKETKDTKKEKIF